MLILLVVKIILPLWACQWATKIIYILSFRINVCFWNKLRICHWYYRLLYTLRILNTVEFKCALFKKLDILRFISYVACVHTVYTNIIFCLDGYVIGHYANNARDFLYPAVPPYPGSGRELTLFKTSLFNPIRITVSIRNFDGKSLRPLIYSQAL